MSWMTKLYETYELGAGLFLSCQPLNADRSKHFFQAAFLS